MSENKYNWAVVRASSLSGAEKDVEIGVDISSADRYFFRADIPLELGVRAIFFIRKGFDPDNGGEVCYKRQEVSYEKTESGYYIKWKEGSEFVPKGNGRKNSVIFLIDATVNKD